MNLTHTASETPDDVEEDLHSDCLVSVERLRALCDPFANPPWAGVTGMTVEAILQAMGKGLVKSRPYSARTSAGKWKVQSHIARIAYLALHGWDDPIDIDVGVPSLNCWIDWPVIDGNHRLAAAIVRGDEFIRADLVGSCDHMVELFGQTLRTRPE